MSGNYSPVAELALVLHNEFRAKHGVPPLTLSSKLCDEAEAYAIARSKWQLGRVSPGLGRNIYQNQISMVDEQGAPCDTNPEMTFEESVRDAVTGWYSHAAGFNYAEPLKSAKIAKYFSQLVWKGSTELGVGVGRSAGNTVVVALYSPQGNIMYAKDYLANVLPPVCP